jgi:hypothetical protein
MGVQSGCRKKNVGTKEVAKEEAKIVANTVFAF